MACKTPCLSRMCSQRGVQMGTPEQDTPGQPQRTDGGSAEGQSQVCRVRALTTVGQAMEVPGPAPASTPPLPPAGPQLPGSVPPSGAKTADRGAKCHQPAGALLRSWRCPPATRQTAEALAVGASFCQCGRATPEHARILSGSSFQLASPLRDFRLESSARQPTAQLPARPPLSHSTNRTEGAGSLIHIKPCLEHAKPLLRALRNVCIIPGVAQCLRALLAASPCKHSALPFAVPQPPQARSQVMPLHLLFPLQCASPRSHSELSIPPKTLF